MGFFNIEFSFRLDHLSGLIAAGVLVFTFLTALYTMAFLKNNRGKFYAYLLLSLLFSIGAVLADNLVVMLFFWEGLLLVLFGMISLSGSTQAFRTAIKAFIIVGISDLCMMIGIALTGSLSGTLNISQISLVPESTLTSAAFILLVIGAIAKAGSMPFHTWIPDAAADAPLPFMAYFPAAMEKLLGIYFLSRICLDMFILKGGSGLSILLMTVGAITIILAVMMALIQKDYKRLLSYHAISQVGYMVLGIGTALPAGIIGGLFHMINNAIYKSCLFFTAGAVEKEAGTTDLQRLGGLYRKMPITFIGFSIAAVSISGVWPFNGFFSKELIYDAALERGRIFYIIALLGSFFTAASFLKLGHAVFLGKSRQEQKGVKEAPLAMLIPIVLLALACVIFGVFNNLPINKFIRPILEGSAHIELHSNMILIYITALVLMAALIHHIIAVKIAGSGVKASDHIHHAPVLSIIYQMAEERYFDPYEMGVKFADSIARLLWRVDRIIDWIYDSFLTKTALSFSKAIRGIHSGYYVVYLIWSLVGALLCLIYLS